MKVLSWTKRLVLADQGRRVRNRDFLTILLLHLQLCPSPVINPQRLAHVAHPFQSRKQVDRRIDRWIVQNT